MSTIVENPGDNSRSWAGTWAGTSKRRSSAPSGEQDERGHHGAEADRQVPVPPAQDRELTLGEIEDHQPGDAARDQRDRGDRQPDAALLAADPGDPRYHVGRRSVDLLLAYS